MLQFDFTTIFSEDELEKQQVAAVSQFMQHDTPHRVEASIEFARYLNSMGLNSDNYPLFLEFLRDENHHVIDALLGDESAFDFFKKVQLNRYQIKYCFEMLNHHKPGGLYDRTLELIFGILYRNYHSAKEGYALFPLTVENLNSIGKYLDKEQGQQHAVNRFILNVLGDIAGYTSLNFEDENVDRIASHAVDIRNAFFDRTVGMNTVIPEELLERVDHREQAVQPRNTNPYQET